MKLMNKIKVTAIISDTIHVTSNLFSKFYPIIFSSLIFCFSSQRTILCIYYVYLLLSPPPLLYFCAFTSKSIDPISILFRIFFVQFLHIFIVSPTLPISIHSCTLFSYIFTLDYNFGSFVPPFLTVFHFYLFFFLSSFSITDFLSLFFCPIAFALFL